MEFKFFQVLWCPDFFGAIGLVQALNGISGKLGTDGMVPAFGYPTGFVINYATNRAIRFNLQGRALELLPMAYHRGRATLSVREREIPDGLVASGAS
jgi:hypothetical protein